MKQTLILIVRAYQALLAPLLGGACKFHPSCSQYAVEAIERHGARRGAWLALKRLLRCHPFGAGGYDPVPNAPGHVEASLSSPTARREPACGHLQVAATHTERAQ